MADEINMPEHDCTNQFHPGIGDWVEVYMRRSNDGIHAVICGAILSISSDMPGHVQYTIHCTLAGTPQVLSLPLQWAMDAPVNTVRRFMRFINPCHIEDVRDVPYYQGWHAWFPYFAHNRARLLGGPIILFRRTSYSPIVYHLQPIVYALEEDSSEATPGGFWGWTAL
ncbi:hypothetical protein DENSPDRAFT_849990 [Dentipellis sp. KUC8613]|nr:hypothetical protein DENSPDRAFT_849990 [Dentipellis sp. KUC8613]